MKAQAVPRIKLDPVEGHHVYEWADGIYFDVRPSKELIRHLRWKLPRSG